MALHPVLAKIIKRCQQDPAFFIDKFCKVKHPKLGIIPFKLFEYQKRCLKDFQKHRFNIFRKCIAKGSFVWTPNGPIKIEDLKIGDLVYTYDDNNKLLKTSPVLSKLNNGLKKVLEVRTKTGHKSLATSDHPYLTRRGWVEAGKLTQNDVLIEICDPIRYGNTKKCDAILLGYLLSDGYLGKKQVHFTNTRWKYLLEFQKQYEIKFNERLKIRKHNYKDSLLNKHHKKSYRIHTYSNECKEWLKDLNILGLTSTNKVIPEHVFKWDNEHIGILLNRLYAGDGWYSGDHCNEVWFGSNSETMLNQVKQLLSRFGINSKLYFKDGFGKVRIFGGDDFKIFVNKIGIFGKSPKVDNVTNGFLFNRKKGQILSVKPVESYVETYDIEVPPYDNFIVDGSVVHNCRQVGISTLTGAFALWYGMFFSNKTILVVSRTDPDAKQYLGRNIKFVYSHLPDWMKELWPPDIMNEHTLGFKNGSTIRSLTSNPDTLRSNASSLNIIDEAAFIQHMEEMWRGGYSTLQTGGSCIVISTPKGVGNWYYKTWSESVDGENEFNPILINWWDMDWTLKFKDELSSRDIEISPAKDIKKLETIDDIEKYGPYWSPWLESQYGDLATRGDDSAFRQEVLAEFLGSGATVLGRNALFEVERMVNEYGKDYQTVGMVNYTNSCLNEQEMLDFNGHLWIWKKPYNYEKAKATIEDAKRRNVLDKLPDCDKRPHTYVIGADTSTGEADDYCALQVFDIDTHEQVAELRIKVLPKIFARMADYVGRMYNGALIVPERTGIGATLCAELEYELQYPTLYRHKSQTAQLKLKYNKTGFPTSASTKHTLVKCLKDYVGIDGWTIRSHRLYRELCIFIHLGNGRYGNERGLGNSDDLVLATTFALVGIPEAIMTRGFNLAPIHSVDISSDAFLPTISAEKEHELLVQGGRNALFPVVIPSEVATGRPDIQAELAKFTSELGGIHFSKSFKKSDKDSVSFKKHVLKYFKQ